MFHDSVGTMHAKIIEYLVFGPVRENVNWNISGPALIDKWTICMAR